MLESAKDASVAAMADALVERKTLTLKGTQRYSHLSTKSLSEAANSASIAIQRGMQAVAA